MKSLNNYFHIKDSRRQVVAERGEFTIESGIIKPIAGKYLVGQYIRVIGSVMNDGVYGVESVGEGYIDVSLTDDAYPPWAQPTGAVDAYPLGARVTHNGVRYVSTIPANTTVPGVGRYWEVVGAVEHSLRNEVFTGAVAALAVPADFLSLVREIEAFEAQAQKNVNRGMIQSESFGGYAYSMATGPDGLPATWKETFQSRLNPYRKMFDEVIL